ncbi:MAG: ATP-binding cassette domain-containing protein [Chloroflexota bacterium]|nr:ATP-binding cassette domain-containing protein [Chloroflexota bacterium]
MEPMVRVDDLVKRYPKRPVNAVDGISFEVPRGEVFGLLGPNGAGKTTTIGILTTRVRPSGGRATIAGIDVARDPAAVKRHLAVVPQRVNLDRSLTARQNLLFHAAYFGYSRREREARADALLQQFGLGDRGGDKTDKYSGGMAQRLMIARALMHEPELLSLDEPTTGLDPQARLFVWDRIRELNARGLTVLLTTHDMDEAETLCHRVAIMDHGKILAIDTPEALKTLIPGASALELGIALPGSRVDPVTAIGDIVEALRILPGVERIERLDTTPAEAAGTAPGPSGPWGSGAALESDRDGLPRIRLYAADAATLIAPAAGIVTRHSATIGDLHVSQASLEDVFIHLTGRGLR